jgi:hypothetical protein
MNFPVLLAADISDVLWVLFVLVAMVSGIINKFKENKAADEMRQRRAQRGGPGREQLQDEISQFLDELGSETPQQRPQPRQQRSRRESAQQRRRETAVGQDRDESSADTRSRSGRGRKRQDQDISSVKKRHVQSSVQDRHVRSSVHNRHLDSEVGDHQVGTFGGATDEITDADITAMAAAGVPPVAQMLRSRNGIASAIVLNEILSPPVSRRTDRRV